MDTPQTQPDNSADVEIANRIMNAMVVKAVNLKSLSDTTGISYSTLRRSLHQSRPDRRSFSFREFRRIATALKVPASTLLPDDLAERSAA
jgi:lambda repressor-like predicted transcriptional regulator